MQISKSGRESLVDMFGCILTGERGGAPARSNQSLQGQMRQREANENVDKSKG